MLPIHQEMRPWLCTVGREDSSCRGVRSQGDGAGAGSHRRWPGPRGHAFHVNIIYTNRNIIIVGYLVSDRCVFSFLYNCEFRSVESNSCSGTAGLNSSVFPTTAEMKIRIACSTWKVKCLNQWYLNNVKRKHTKSARTILHLFRCLHGRQ